MPQADKKAGAILGTILTVGAAATIFVICIANKGEQISKHIEANASYTVTTPYNLPHTGGPQNSMPTAPMVPTGSQPIAPCPSATYLGTVYNDAFAGNTYQAYPNTSQPPAYQTLPMTPSYPVPPPAEVYPMQADDGTRDTIELTIDVQSGDFELPSPIDASNP